MGFGDEKTRINEIEEAGGIMFLEGLDLDEVLFDEIGPDREALERGWLRMKEKKRME